MIANLLIKHPWVEPEFLRLSGAEWEISRVEYRDKKSQESPKKAFMANNQIPHRGVEPLSRDSQVLENKKLTENTNPVLSTSLDNFVQIYPDLVGLVEAWPELPENTKTAIKALIQAHKAEQK